MAKTKKRQMYVADKSVQHGYSPATVYWARGGLAVTRLPEHDWAITATSCGFSIGTMRWSDPKKAVAQARVWLQCADWRRLTFDQVIRQAPVIQKRYSKVVRRIA